MESRLVPLQLTNAGEDVVVFYNDKASFNVMLELMAESREGVGENSPLRYKHTGRRGGITGASDTKGVLFTEQLKIAANAVGTNKEARLE